MIALYGHEAYHSAPISLNMVLNTLLQEFMGDSYRITINNDPIRPMCPTIYDLKSIPILIFIFMWGKLKIWFKFFRDLIKPCQQVASSLLNSC